MAQLNPIDRPSPNHGERRGGAAPDMIVLHYTAMETAEAALDRLCDPAAEVSAHYLVAEDGRLWRLVAEDRRAWHAGRARWGDVEDVNSRSIGIELANRGDHPFPEPQIAVLEALLDALRARWSVPPERVLGHACVAPGRKRDPGRRFDWRRLALGGRAVWLDAPAVGGAAADAARFQRAARRFGAPAPATGLWDEDTQAVAAALGDRFRPWAADPCDAGAVALAEALAERWPVAPG
jgi:N-acetylmuramoyl-L-alanine amidase